MKYSMRATWMLVAIAVTCLPLGAGEPPEPDQARVRASIQRMFDHGFEPGPAGLKAAEENYRDIAHLASTDPRIDYAWGLVLLRQFRHGEATERFLAATERPGEPFWPAWRALIWCRLTAGQFDPGLGAVEALTELLLDNAGGPEPKRETALWVGRTLAALEITTEPADRKERIVALDLEIRERLAPDLLQAYESGKPQTWKQHAELLREIQELREETVEKNTQAREEAQQQIQAGLQNLAKRKEAVANAADNWKHWLDEQARHSDRQLIALRKDTAYLQRRAASVQQSLYLIGVERTALDAWWRLSRPRQAADPQPSAFALQRMFFTGREWVLYQSELLETLQRMRAVDRQATLAQLQRRAAAGRQMLATRRLDEQNDALNARAGRLLRQATELDQQPLDRTPQLAAMMLRAHQLSTYVDIDLAVERNQILKSFEAL